MPIQYENMAAVPEAEKNDFIEFEVGGKTLAYHKDFAESKKAEFRLQGDLTTLTNESKGMKTKLDDLTAAEKTRSDAAEDERTKGLSATERQNEIIANLTKTVATNQETYTASIAESAKKANDGIKAALVSDMAAVGTEATRGILKRMAAADLDMSDDGTFTVLDADGKATAETVAEYKANLKTRYPSLVSAVQSKGGNGLGGAGGESDGTTVGSTIAGFSDLPVK